VYGAFQPFVGQLIDRFGARTLVVAGALLMGASLVATGYVTRLWHLYLWFGVVSSIGLAATGPVSARPCCRRGSRRRARRSVLGSASMAGMTLLGRPRCGASRLRLADDLRAVRRGLGGADRAARRVLRAQHARGARADARRAAGGAVRGSGGLDRTDLADASRTRPFWQLALGLFTCGFSMSLLSAHGVPMLTDHGYHPMLASWTLGVLGGSSAAFGIVLGALSDRFGSRPMLAWLYASRALIFLGLFLIRDQPLVILVVAVLEA
jgi:MFS family permease